MCDFGRKDTRESLTPICWLVSAALSGLSYFAIFSTAKIPSWEDTLKLTAGLDNRLLTSVIKLRLVTRDSGVLGFLAVIALFLFFHRYLTKTFRKKLSVNVLLPAGIFAMIMPIGMSIQTYNGLDFLLANRFQMAYGGLLFLGFGVLFYALIDTLYSYLDLRISECNDQKCFFSASPNSDTDRKWLTLLLDKKPFLIPMITLLVCWIPIWIAYFPGSVEWDMLTQLNYYFGEFNWTDHHPVVATCIYGTLMHLGRSISGDSMGIFFCSLYQHLLLSSCMAFSLLKMKKWGLSQDVRLFVLMFYAFCPLVALWPSSNYKDCSYFALALLFGVQFISLIQALKEKQNVKKAFIEIVLTGIVIPLIRHDGLYICVLVLILLALFDVSKNHRGHCILAVIVIAVVSTTISNAAVALVGAQEGSVREALSIPFQQTARYVKEHYDEVTEEERLAIDAVLDYEKLPEVYDPDISDNVKGTYRKNDKALPKYLLTWFKMFFKHPITYFEATLCNSYSYYYPNGESTTKMIVISGIIKNPLVNTGFFDLKYEFDTVGLQKGLYNGWLYLFKNLPGVGMLIHAGTYTWILLLGCFYALFHKKKYFLLGFAPALLNVLVCIASPVNGYFRYFMPTVLLTPIIIGWMLCEMEKDRRKETK